MMRFLVKALTFFYFQIDRGQLPNAVSRNKECFGKENNNNMQNVREFCKYNIRSVCHVQSSKVLLKNSLTGDCHITQYQSMFVRQSLVMEQISTNDGSNCGSVEPVETNPEKSVMSLSNRKTSFRGHTLSGHVYNFEPWHKVIFSTEPKNLISCFLFILIYFPLRMKNSFGI